MLQSMRSGAKYIWWFLVAAFIGSFLLYETSGLAGRSPVTNTTAVATVDGEEILLTSWQRLVSDLEKQESDRLGHPLTMDERRTVEDRAYDQLVNEVLLRQEYARRSISVSDDEIRNAALSSPPPGAINQPDLQTDGRFDMQKYQRLLASPMARQSGMLANLESYYKSEIPKQKLFDQIASDVFLSDARLWQIYKDRHDSATVSFVTIRTDALTDTAVTVTDADVSQYYERNKKRFEQPGRAVLSLVTIPRVVTAADSSDAKAKIDRLRAEITGGAKFEDVAKRESADTVSGAQGGSLGTGGKNRFAPKFEDAAYALKPGELSQPVLTPFGWHLIKVDTRKGDTLTLRHILVTIAQGDSSANRTDKTADELSKIAANAEESARFDSAAKVLTLTPASVVAIEKEVLTFAGRQVPSVSAWAFSGVHVGESSDLFDSPDAYYLARLDSLHLGGTQPLADVKDDIRRRLSADKRLEKLVPVAQGFATEARSSSLETMATAHKLTVEQSKPFARIELVPGLGQFTEAIGGAFTSPIAQVSPPLKANDALVLLRVNSRTDADKKTFETQKTQQRESMTQSMREQRVDEYVAGLRETKKIVDHRQKVMSQLRRQSIGS